MTSRATTLALLATAALVLSAVPVGAHIGGAPGSGEPWKTPPPSEDFRVPRGAPPCPNDHPEWREAQTVHNVSMLASPVCQPDNPELVSAFVQGTNHMPQEVLDRNALHEEAVVKCCDRDGDGDPDVINITLEVIELNGWHLAEDDLAETFDIGPGIHPGFWVFSPKGTIAHTGEAFFDVARMPTTPIRVEQGDRVRLTMENTHYFPHTIHLHGVDHPFIDAQGEGNDGVPGFSERPVMPGEKRTYDFQARQPGSMFFHCHVQPDKHVMMGLGTFMIIEEDREDNRLQTFNPGGGHVRAPSKASQEAYDREYDLIYHDVDKELHEIVQQENDPRVIAKQQNRVYDSTERTADYFLMNGRLFPYTLRESPIVVAPDEEVRLRILNSGEETLSLHPHGHKVLVTHKDGVELEVPYHRDVVTITAAQRLDVTLNTTDDGLSSYGQGVWFMHDHREHATTTDGINPGGDITVIAYESFLNRTTAMPETVMPLNVFFTEEYYRGELPVWGMLGDQWYLGEIADQSQGQDETTPAPGPDVWLMLGAVVGLALIVARTRREVRP